MVCITLELGLEWKGKKAGSWPPSSLQFEEEKTILQVSMKSGLVIAMKERLCESKQ